MLLEDVQKSDKSIKNGTTGSEQPSPFKVTMTKEKKVAKKFKLAKKVQVNKAAGKQIAPVNFLDMNKTVINFSKQQDRS